MVRTFFRISNPGSFITVLSFVSIFSSSCFDVKLAEPLPPDSGDENTEEIDTSFFFHPDTDSFPGWLSSGNENDSDDSNVSSSTDIDNYTESSSSGDTSVISDTEDSHNTVQDIEESDTTKNTSTDTEFSSEEYDDTESHIVNNHAPIANAGGDFFGFEAGVPIQLDGSGSSDPDGDVITYNWEITLQPSGSTASLSDASSPIVTFTPDVEGMYKISLVVNDGDLNSQPDVVTISSLEELLFEDFENGCSAWSADNGVWEVGTPTYGCSEARSGNNVAGTVLAGDYPTNNSRMITPSIQLPTIRENTEIRLSFWQWFDFAAYVERQIHVCEETAPGEWSDWVMLDPLSYGGSGGGIWTLSSADLSGYSGKKVRVGFLLQMGYRPLVSTGWYLDDISVQLF